MKALNTKERNTAILGFSLWLIISVLIICIPIILTSYVKGKQKDIQDKENTTLIDEINFEKEYFAVQIQKILDLMKGRQANEISSESFNAELMNIVSDIKKQTDGELNWRGDMYRNVVVIAEYLIAANMVISRSGEHKDKQISELNKIILEFESCGDNIAGLSDERKKKEIYQSIDAVDRQFRKATKMLSNFKESLK